MPTQITHTNYHYNLKSVDPLLPHSQELIVSENPLQVLCYFHQNGKRVNSYKNVELEHYGSTSKLNGKTFITRVDIQKSAKKPNTALDEKVFANMENNQRIKKEKHDAMAKELYQRFKRKDQRVLDYLINDSQAQIFQEISEALGISYSTSQLESYLNTGEFWILQRSHEILGGFDLRENFVRQAEPTYRTYEDEEFESGIHIDDTTANVIIGPDGGDFDDEDVIIGPGE